MNWDFPTRFEGHRQQLTKKRFRVVVGSVIIIGICLGITGTVLAQQRSAPHPVAEPGAVTSPTLGTAVAQTRPLGSSIRNQTEPIPAATVSTTSAAVSTTASTNQPTVSGPAAEAVDPEPYEEDFEPTCLVSNDGSVTARLQVAAGESIAGSITGSDGVELRVEGDVGNSQFHLSISDARDGSVRTERWWLLEDGVELPDGSSLFAVMCDAHQ